METRELMLLLGVLLFFGGCVFGAVQCNSQDNETIRECIKSGTPANICAMLRQR